MFFLDMHVLYFSTPSKDQSMFEFPPSDRYTLSSGRRLTKFFLSIKNSVVKF